MSSGPKQIIRNENTVIDISFKIANCEDALRASDILANIADSFGDTDTSPKRRRRTKAEMAAAAAPGWQATESVEVEAKPDAVSLYLAAGGALPEPQPGPEPELGPDEPDEPEQEQPVATISKAELLAKVRPIAQDLGVAWMIPFLKKHGVETISQLPKSVLVGIMAGETDV